MFANDGPGRGILAVENLSLDGHLPVSHEAGSHRPDIGFASRSGPSHGVEPRSTPHQQAGRAFIGGVASAVLLAHAAYFFGALDLAANYGELGEVLRKKVQERIDDEYGLEIARGPSLSS